MSQLPYKEFHLLQLFQGFEYQTLPLDVYLHHYFRTHKSLGPKDRAFLAEHIFGYTRWKTLIEHLAPRQADMLEKIELWRKLDPVSKQQDSSIPQHVRVSMPELLFQKLVQAYGLEKAIELALICNTQAPTTVRANLLKTDRDTLLELWKRHYDVAACETSPWGIVFKKRESFFSLPEFTEGLFEVQDEGSQLLAALMQVQPGQQVCDYCAGSGGKTLAFGALMQNKGQIYLHDIRPRALTEARKRMNRAGLQNVQFIQAESRALKLLKNRMDWVLVDVPCSGTGTLRRNPDMKWRFFPETISNLVQQQRLIVEHALQLIKPKGKIVYGTCSILPEENQQQIDYFCRTFNLKVSQTPMQTFPTQGGMDGFFGAVLERV